MCPLALSRRAQPWWNSTTEGAAGSGQSHSLIRTIGRSGLTSFRKFMSS